MMNRNGASFFATRRKQNETRCLKTKILRAGFNPRVMIRQQPGHASGCDGAVALALS